MAASDSLPLWIPPESSLLSSADLAAYDLDDIRMSGRVSLWKGTHSFLLASTMLQNAILM